MGFYNYNVGTPSESQITDWERSLNVSDIVNILKTATGTECGIISSIKMNLDVSVTVSTGSPDITVYVSFANEKGDVNSNSSNKFVKIIEPFVVNAKNSPNASKVCDLKNFFNLTYPYSANSNVKGFSKLFIYFDTGSIQTKNYKINKWNFDITFSDSHTITVSVDPQGGGTVTGAGVYNHNDEPILEAKESPGWSFSHWKDNESIKTASRKILVDKNVEYTAVFSQNSYTITWANIDGNNGTTTTSAKGGTIPSYSGTPMKATDNNGHYEFEKWDKTPTIAIDNVTYTAIFKTIPHDWGNFKPDNNGKTHSQYCNKGCNNYTNQNEHIYDKIDVVDPERDSLGYTRHTCTICGYFKDDTPTCKITLLDENENLIKEEIVGQGSEIKLEPKEKDSSVSHHFIFDGWLDQDGNRWEQGTLASKNLRYKAQYIEDLRSYTAYWYNDEELLDTTEVYYGYPAQYYGETPTKQSEADWDYTWEFAGWSPNNSQGIIGDTIYKAQFAIKKVEYIIRWVNASNKEGEEGLELEKDIVYYNTQPDYNGATPIHPNESDTNFQWTYNFKGWSANVENPPLEDKDLEKVTGNITYTAIYEQKLKKHSIIVKRYDGDTYREEEILTAYYGDTVSLDAYYYEVIGHDFVEWDDGTKNPLKEFEVQGPIKYTAIYEKKKYNVQWINEGQLLLEEKNIWEYGSKPIYNGTPTKAHDTIDGYHYVFEKWEPIKDINGNSSIKEDGTITGNIAFSTVFIPVSHNWDVSEPIFYDDYRKCKIIGRCSYTGEEHTETLDVAVKKEINPAPTCTETGKTIYSANFDVDWAGEFEEIIILPELGHNWKGQNLGDGNHLKQCTVCKEWVTENHTFDEGVVTGNACLIGGIRTKTCSVDGCGVQTEEKIEQAAGHQLYFIDEKQPTCTENGNEIHWRCSVCHKYFKNDTDIYLEGTSSLPNELIKFTEGHKYEITKITKATCTDFGLKDIYCPECEERKFNVLIYPRGHKMEKTGEPPNPSCWEEGKQNWECVNGEDNEYSECDYTNIEIIPRTPHQEKIIKGISPTCISKGTSDKKICSLCNEILIDQYDIPALGHLCISKSITQSENALRRGVIYVCTRKDCDYHYNLNLNINKN